MSMKKKDVHTEHCCIAHGCKYGNKDCSVVTGKKEQSFPCEVCGMNNIMTMAQLRKMMNPPIMKIMVIDWAYGCKDKLAALGLEDRKVIELTWDGVQELITKIFIETKGVNVMLMHRSPDDKDADMNLCLDDKRFQQR